MKKQLRLAPDISGYHPLSKSMGYTKASNIQSQIEKHIDLWIEGHFSALVADYMEEALLS